MSGAPEHPTSEPACLDTVFPPAFDVVASGLGVLAVLAIANTAQDADGDLTKPLAIYAGVAIGFGASAYVGFDRASKCESAHRAWKTRPRTVPRPPPPFAPFVEHVPATDPEAARLTHEAHAAAVEQRCAPTAANGPRVNYLDPEYYDKVFLADDAIARCR